MMRYRSHNCSVTAEFNKVQFILRRVYLTILQALQRGLRPHMFVARDAHSLSVCASLSVYGSLAWRACAFGSCGRDARSLSPARPLGKSQRCGALRMPRNAESSSPVLPPSSPAVGAARAWATRLAPGPGPHGPSPAGHAPCSSDSHRCRRSQFGRWRSSG